MQLTVERQRLSTDEWPVGRGLKEWSNSGKSDQTTSWLEKCRKGAELTLQQMPWSVLIAEKGKREDRSLRLD